jgi:hypothetical protein
MDADNAHGLAPVETDNGSRPEDGDQQISQSPDVDYSGDAA